MAQPTLRNVRAVDTVLSNFAIVFKPADLIGEQVAPLLKVDEPTGTIFKMTRDFALRIGGENLQRSPQGTYHRAGYTWGTTTYETQEYGVEYPAPLVVSAGSQVPIDLERVATEMGAKDLALELERQVAAEALNTNSKWASDTALAGTDQWNDYGFSNPIADIDARKESILQNAGVYPNTGYLGLQVWNKLKEHPLLIDKIKYTGKGILSEEAFASMVEIQKILVGRAIRNTAAEGATFSGSFIWGKHMVLEYKEAPGVESRLGVLTFAWDEGGVAFPRAVETYEEKQSRSNIIRTFAHWQVKVVESQYGQRISSAVA